MTLSPLGKELDISGTEGLVYQVPMSGEQNAANGLRTFFPDLPSEPAPIGYTWTSHDTIHAAENIDLTIIMITKNTLAALETIDGKECVKITGIVTGTIQGSGEQAGMNVALESDMEGTETWYFAYKEGMFVQTAVSIQSEGTIAISGAQNMTMPMTQESKINVKLVK